MTPLAPHITAFLHKHLPIERRASPHTCDTYAYAFQLLFEFAAKRLRIRPSDLALEHLDSQLILAFLEHIQDERKNSAQTRNARLAAIKSFMAYVEHRVPGALEQARRVLTIPGQRPDSRLVRHLTVNECQALLAVPNPETHSGIRDRAMIYVAITGGLRVSELVGLRLEDLTFEPRRVCLRVHGKGRKERMLLLWQTVAEAVRAWLAIRGTAQAPELFLNARRQPMTRGGFEYVLKKHLATAVAQAPSLAQKRVSPHVLRHTCAMNTLQATGDIRKVALWLGHASTQTTEIYLRADPTQKLETLGKVIPPTLRPGTFKPSDRLIAMLRGQDYVK
jgi:site-specific recombinase XerD